MTPTNQPEAAHTPEPWSVAHLTADLWAVLSERKIVVTMTEEANARRIVACVNAMAGIAEPGAVAEVVDALSFYMSICGNTAYSVTRESALMAYEKGKAALAKLNGRGE